MVQGKIIIIPFLLPWNWSADYQKQTCLTLAKNNKVIAYMQKDAYFFLTPKKRRYPHIKNISFHQPINILPFTRIALIEKINKLISFIILKKQLNPLQNVILWLFDPKTYFYPSILKTLSIYDCVDYHWKPEKTLEIQIKENEKKLIKSVDYFIVNSKTLATLHKPIRKPDALVPQGFRLQDFKNPKKIKVSLPKNKPLIGFVGAISSRLDIDLLTKLTEHNPQWRFVLWGPKQTYKTDSSQIKQKLNSLLSHHNVITGLTKDRRQIPSLISKFDIGIVPYDITQVFNRYCYPMKLFEYFYMGKPVLATPIEELKHFPKFVKIGKTAKEWERHIKTFLAKPWLKKYQKEEKKLAEANSWERKIEEISQLIE